MRSGWGAAAARSPPGSTATVTFGADIELSPTGVWTKYLHSDAVRVGPDATTNTTWLTRDHSQSIRIRTDATGARTELSFYRPYGEPASAPPPNALSTSKQYIGERYDTEFGLSYLNARYMDPVLGRTPNGTATWACG